MKKKYLQNFKRSSSEPRALVRPERRRGSRAEAGLCAEEKAREIKRNMFEYLPESGEKKSRAGREFRTIYLCLIVLFFADWFFQITLAEKLVYLWYGYSPAIIGTSDMEAFRAFDETLPAMKLLHSILLGVTFLCFVFSCIAIYLRLYLKFYFTFAVFILTLLGMFLFLLSLTIFRAGILG